MAVWQKAVFDVAPVASGFALRRNRAEMQTPAGKQFVVPTRSLADALATEWSACGEKDGPDKRPLTQLAATAIDLIADRKNEVAAAVSAAAATDLLCHHQQEPADLALKQIALWQPWLDWARQRYGAELVVTHGIMPATQPEKALQGLSAVVAALDPFTLAGLQQAASVSGSLVLGLALMEGAASAEQLFEAAELEALYQIEKWGEDPVTVKRQASVRSDLELCQSWFNALKID